VVPPPKWELRDRAREAGEGECRQLLEIVEGDLHPLSSRSFPPSPIYAGEGDSTPIVAAERDRAIDQTRVHTRAERAPLRAAMQRR